MARPVVGTQPEPGSSRQQPEQPQVEHERQVVRYSHYFNSSRAAHGRAWLAEGVRLASWARKWLLVGDNPYSLILAMQGMLASLFHMSVFVSFRKHHVVTCAVNLLHALLYCRFASVAWLQQEAGWDAGAEAHAAADSPGCPRALLPAVLSHGPRCIILCSFMYQLPLRWALFQLAAASAIFLWHTPEFCKHNAACGMLACQASYASVLLVVSALLAVALRSTK